MDCPHTQLIGPLHDGELPAAQAHDLQAHLAQCPACRAELARLHDLSARIGALSAPGVRPMVLARLHAQADRYAQQRGLLRLVESLTSVAAAILLVALVGLWRDAPAVSAAPAPWEEVAVAPHAQALLARADQSGTEIDALWLAAGVGAEEDDR